MLLAGVIVVGCESNATKVKTAEDDLRIAKENLKQTQIEADAEAKRIAEAEEWEIFKAETQVKILENETRIAELKVKLKKPGKVLDPIYVSRIEALESTNEELKKRISIYEASKSDWAKFKAEFNSDMDNLIKSIKEF